MRNIVLLVLAGVVLIVGSSSIFTIRETEQVLVRQFGEPKRVIDDPGLHFKLPFPFEETTYFDKRLLDFDASSQEIPTKDQKQLLADAFARYRIVDALKFFQTVGTEFGANARLGNVINSSLRSVLGEVNQKNIMTGERARLMEQITAIASENARGFGIEVVDVRLKRVDLPPENSQAIYRRMQTQREQEARKTRAEGDQRARSIRAEGDKRERVILAEAKKNAEILRGEGDAQAQAVYNDAYGRDEEFFDFWRSMQALQKGLGGDNTTFVGSPDGDFFRFFQNESGAKPAE